MVSSGHHSRQWKIWEWDPRPEVGRVFTYYVVGEEGLHLGSGAKEKNKKNYRGSLLASAMHVSGRRV